MKLFYRQCVGRSIRTALFQLMKGEGLLPCAMERLGKALAQGLAVPDRPARRRGAGCAVRTRPGKSWAAACSRASPTASGSSISRPSEPDSPWRRNQARGGFQWAFDHLDCTSIMGVCRCRTAMPGGWPKPAASAFWRAAQSLLLRPQGQLCGRRAGALHA